MRVFVYGTCANFEKGDKAFIAKYVEKERKPKNNKHKNNNTGLKNMLGSQQTLFSLVSFESFAPHFSIKKKQKKRVYGFTERIQDNNEKQSYKEIDNVVNLLLQTLSK